jgi:hypothetical protein
VSRVRTWLVSRFLGLPASLLALLTLIDALTSQLDGEGGGCACTLRVLRRRRSLIITSILKRVKQYNLVD